MTEPTVKKLFNTEHEHIDIPPDIDIQMSTYLLSLPGVRDNDELHHELMNEIWDAVDRKRLQLAITNPVKE